MANSINSTSALVPVNVIRSETVLSRYPIHRLSRQGVVSINIERKDENGITTFRWEVSHSSQHGQPGPLAYKLDTLVINRRIENAGRPLAKVIRLGSLREIAQELNLGADTNIVRKSLLQNAFAGITMKGTYKSHTGEERTVDAAFTRYDVIMTGQRMEDGQRAEAVYIILHDIYQEVLNHAKLRPLDYDYLKILTPAAQRWYELVSYQIYAALKHNRPRAKLAYSEFCACSTITRHLGYEQVKKQMYKIHRPHLREEYLERVVMEPSVDEEGMPDWLMWYWPGQRARSQHEAFLHGRKYPRMQGDLFPDGKVTPDEEGKVLALLVDELAVREPVELFVPSSKGTPHNEIRHTRDAQELVEELASLGLNRDDAIRLVAERPEECRRQLAYIPFITEFKSSRGAYLRSAIEKRFGPPKGYEAAQKDQSEQKEAEARVNLQTARQRHEATCRDAYLAYLASEVVAAQNRHAEAYEAFLKEDAIRRQGHLQRAKSKLGQKILEEFDQEEARLLRFAESFRQHPGRPVLDFWRWDKQLNPKPFAPSTPGE